MNIEIWQYITISILLTFSAIAKAVQDTLSWHYDKSVFTKGNPSYWNENLAWSNKYHWSNNKFISWLLQNPLVSITSGWHTFGLIRDFTLFSIIPVISGNYWLFLGYLPYRLVFHIFFTWIFIKR